MKKYSLFILILFSIAACSKKEEKFELFSAEAYAYSLDYYWELNASCMAKGFQQNDSNDKFIIKLSYTIDLKTPDGKVLEVIDKGLIDQTNAEKIIDLAINSQLQLDSSYKVGSYNVIFNVTDDFSGRKTSISKSFELSK